MSYTTVLAVWPGEKVEPIKKLGNSWGSAPYVWEKLAGRYLGLHSAYDWLHQHSDRVFGLWKDQNVPAGNRAVLMLTFLRGYVLKRDFIWMAEGIERFLTEFPDDPKIVNHWPTIALIFRTASTLGDGEVLESLTEVPAIALHCTSVDPNPFLGPYNSETDDLDPFDWSTAFDIYGELAKLCETPSTSFS